MEKEKIKFFWTYTTVLFAVAFALILFAAIASSQHQEFREDEKETFQHNSEMLNELTATLNQKEAKISTLNETLKTQNKRIESLENEKKEYADSAEAVLEAEKQLLAGNRAGARASLDTVNPEILTPNLENIYNNVKNKLN